MATLAPPSALGVLRTVLILWAASAAADGSLISGYGPPDFSHVRRTPSFVPRILSIRGGDAAAGSAAPTADASVSAADDAPLGTAVDESFKTEGFSLVGRDATCVIDLRPDSCRSVSAVSVGSDSNIFGAGEGGCRAVVLVPLTAAGGGKGSKSTSSPSFLLGKFPGSGDGGDFESPEAIEAGLHRLSSAAESLGSSCGAVVLLVACTNDGSTSLHRSAGLMLAGLMNGVRQKLVQNSDGSEGGATKLTLLLFPILDTGEGSGKMVEDWSGAERLVERLRIFHSMGMEDPSADEGQSTGDSSEGNDPFEIVDIAHFHHTPGTSLNALHSMLLKDKGGERQERTSLSCSKMQKLIVGSFKTMGGEGTIGFREITVV